MQDELAGYRDYARRVRYRLLPGIHSTSHLMLSPRDEGIAPDVKPQEPSCPMTRVGHANPGSLDDRQRFRLGRSGDIEIVADEVVPVEASVNMHRFA